MKDGISKTLVSTSPEWTQGLATRLAPYLTPGDTLLLCGEIGAGKSHFARSLIQARLAAVGKTEDIPSPTYTLVQTYSDGDVDIWHADLYRLTDTNEVFELGLQDAFQNSICLVEWPERLGNLKPDNALTIHFEFGAAEHTRILTFHASRNWERKLQPAFQDEARI